MKSLQLFFLLFLVNIPTLFSQAMWVDLPMDYVRNKNFENSSTEVVQGSKYLNDNFQNGIILFGDKEINTLLRYNALAGEFELKNPSTNEVASVVRTRAIKFKVGTSNYAVSTYMGKDDIITEGYFEILNEGNTQLLKRDLVTYKEAEPAPNSYNPSKPARYISSTEYYLKKGSEPAEKVSLNKKDILKIMDTDEARSFVKDNKLKLKSEEEVVKLLNFLNSRN